jgi:hypothetical protein
MKKNVRGGERRQRYVRMCKQVWKKEDLEQW